MRSQSRIVAQQRLKQRVVCFDFDFQYLLLSDDTFKNYVYNRYSIVSICGTFSLKVDSIISRSTAGFYAHKSNRSPGSGYASLSLPLSLTHTYSVSIYHSLPLQKHAEAFSIPSAVPCPCYNPAFDTSGSSPRTQGRLGYTTTPSYAAATNTQRVWFFLIFSCFQHMWLTVNVVPCFSLWRSCMA